jgi:hypothetical protein
VSGLIRADEPARASHPLAQTTFRLPPEARADGRPYRRAMDSALEISNHLQELQAERALASIENLASDSPYTADLDGEIEATTRAYVGAAVTEIAMLRAELSGPQVG